MLSESQALLDASIRFYACRRRKDSDRYLWTFYSASIDVSSFDFGLATNLLGGLASQPASWMLAKHLIELSTVACFLSSLNEMCL